jgi:hypothetical protein
VDEGVVGPARAKLVQQAAELVRTLEKLDELEVGRAHVAEDRNVGVVHREDPGRALRAAWIGLGRGGGAVEHTEGIAELLRQRRRETASANVVVAEALRVPQEL